MNARGQRCIVTFSPQGYFTQVPSGKVQDELRQCFRQWGRPVSLRVDNGYPWGSCGDLPTPLALWLVGLDIGVIWNPPRRPQDKDYTSSCTSFVFSGEALGNRRGSVLLMPRCLSGLFVPTGSYKYSGFSL
jgi:hypothetical protein